MVHWSRLGAVVVLAGTACDPWISPDDRLGGGVAGGTWQAQFAPMIDVSPCQPGLSWCCQTIGVNADGSFSEVWAPNEPNTARFEGVLYEDHMEATFECIGNGTSVAIQADLRGGAYDGTFTFGGSAGCLLVFPWDPPVVALQGKVHDDAGTPLAGATVWTSLQDRVATTNTHGQFYLSTAVEAGLGTDTTYTVRAWAPGYQTFESDSAWGDHPIELDLRLTPL